MIIKLSKIDFGGGTCTGSSECVLTTATFTSNAAYNPPSGVNGFKKVTVNVDLNAPYNSGFTAGFSSGYTSGETAGYASGYTSGETVGYASGETAGAAAQKALLGATSFTANDTFTSENGWSSVTVNVSGGGGGDDRLQKFFGDQLTSITQSDLAFVNRDMPAYCFYYKTNIKTIDLPSTITGMTTNCFSHCDSLTDIDVSHIVNTGVSGLSTASAAFEGDFSLSGLTGFESFSGNTNGVSLNNMFNGCTALRGDFRIGVVNMTNSSSMFAQCTGITSFTFVNNVTTFGTRTNTFTNCSSVTRVDLTNNTVVPPVAVANFNSFNANYEIWVHESLYDTWIATSPWDTISSHIVSKSTRTT